MGSFDTITFLSDFGLVDESVGLIKSVIRSIAPQASVIDLSHNIPLFDIRTGGLMLARSASYLVPGVVLAAVAPGVAGQTKSIAVEVGGGESVLVGPDNGLLAPLVAVCGGVTRAVELTNSKFQLPGPQNSYFAGRDVWAPAAAHLCQGIELTDLGELLDPHELVPATLTFSEVKDGVLYADVIYVDHFGNLELNVAPEQLEAFGPKLRVTVDGRDHRAEWRTPAGSVPGSSLKALEGHSGMILLALEQASASEALAAGLGSAVLISRDS
jgi:S-adenosyl-L-methionine hydrolase (adenosine-forming)